MKQYEQKLLTHVLAPHSLVIGDTLHDTALAELALLGQVVFCRTPIQDQQVAVLLKNEVRIVTREEAALHDVIADQTEAAIGVDELRFRTSLGISFDRISDHRSNFRVDQESFFVIDANSVRLQENDIDD